MKIASALFLSFLFAGAMPAPPDEPGLSFIDRGQQGFLFIDNLPTQAGSVDVLTPWGQPDWAKVRLNDGPWSEPVPFNALAGQQIAVTITFTFCVAYPLVTPYGGIAGISHTEKYTVTVGEDAGQSLEADLQDLKAKVGDLAAGGFLIQC